MSLLAAALLLGALGKPAAGAAASPAGARADLASTSMREVSVAPGLRAQALLPRGIRVTVSARPGESWAELARRLTGRFANAEAVRGASVARAPVPGQDLTVPFELLLPALRREILAALLPRDRCEGSFWVHEPQPGFAPDGSHASLATWFSAGSAGAAALEAQLRRDANPAKGSIRIACVGIAPWLTQARGCCLALSSDEEEDRAEAALDAQGGDLLLVPGALAVAPPRPPIAALVEAGATPAPGGPPVDLLPPAGAPVPAPTPGSRPPGRAAAAELGYGKDASGAYASYRLRAGEALYSSVIVRFTGRVHAREVNELIPIIAERSGVRSLQSLPVGFEVRIPLELLASEFLPASDVRRQDFERRREQVAEHRNQDVAKGLEGVAVLLDAGHGGRDRGAIADGVWESDYVYDVMCRIKRALESTTRARVVPVVRNSSLGYRVRDRRRLEPREDTDVLTDPPYRLDDPVVGVNLRWYLAASVYQKLLAEGFAPGRVVFTSLHADSLHPSVRGAMVYVPSAEHSSGRHGRRGPDYDRRREPREQGYFSFSARERAEAEGRSTDLATRILGRFAAAGIPVHEVKPIRGSVLRNGREWLPAVLRSNPVPARVLLEVDNLNHAEDNRLLELPSFRQRVAEAYVAALLDYYGGSAGSGVVAGRR